MHVLSVFAAWRQPLRRIFNILQKLVPVDVSPDVLCLSRVLWIKHLNLVGLHLLKDAQGALSRIHVATPLTDIVVLEILPNGVNLPLDLDILNAALPRRQTPLLRRHPSKPQRVPCNFLRRLKLLQVNVDEAIV